MLLYKGKVLKKIFGAKKKKKKFKQNFTRPENFSICFCVLCVTGITKAFFSGKYFSIQV